MTGEDTSSDGRTKGAIVLAAAKTGGQFGPPSISSRRPAATGGWAPGSGNCLAVCGSRGWLRGKEDCGGLAVGRRRETVWGQSGFGGVGDEGGEGGRKGERQRERETVEIYTDRVAYAKKGSG